MFDPRLPVGQELDLVQEQVLWPCLPHFSCAPEVQDSVQASQLQQGVIERDIQDVARVYPLGDKGFDRLEEERCLPYLARTAQQDRSWGRRLSDPQIQLRERSTTPSWQVGDPLASPPWIHLPQDGDELGIRHNHRANFLNRLI